MVGADLVRVVETLAPCKDVRLVADDVEYDSVDEFIAESRGKAPKALRITAREPYLTIDFSATSARLYVSTSDITGSGLFAQLVSGIQSCERRPRALYSFWYAVTSTWAIQLAFQIPVLKPLRYLVIWLVIANTIWVFWLLFVQLRRFSVILPIAAQDPRTFWQRNSDNAVVAVFSAVLGAVGGAGATKIADRIWPSAVPPTASVAEPASSANLARPNGCQFTETGNAVRPNPSSSGPTPAGFAVCRGPLKSNVKPCAFIDNL